MIRREAAWQPVERLIEILRGCHRPTAVAAPAPDSISAGGLMSGRLHGRLTRADGRTVEGYGRWKPSQHTSEGRGMSTRQVFRICLALLVVAGALVLAGNLCRGASADAATGVVRSVEVVSRVEGTEAITDPSAIGRLAITDPSAIGRFQIICGPLSREDVYLLDTTSGSTWQMIRDPASGKPSWRPVPQR